MLSAVALVRQSGVPATDTAWAEDAKIFYAQTLTTSFGRALFKTYDGYAQLVPRLLAQFARWAPPGRAAEVFAVGGAIGFALTACLVFHMARGHIGPAPVRVLLVAAMALLPIATAELLDNMVNLPWWLFFAAFWALLWRPRTTAGMVAAGALCFLATASEPLVALFVPLALVRALVLRPLREHAATAGLVVGLVYQGVARLVSGGKSFTPAALHGIGQDYAGAGWAVRFAGMRAADWLMSHSATAAVALGCRHRLRHRRCRLTARDQGVRSFTVAATVFSVVCFVVPIWLRGVSALLENERSGRGQPVPGRPPAPAHQHRHGGGRPPGPPRPAEAPLSPPAHAVPGPPHGAPVRPQREAAVVVCAVMFLPTWVADFRDANLRSAVRHGRSRWPGPWPVAGTAMPAPLSSGSTRPAGKRSSSAEASPSRGHVPLRRWRLGRLVAINGPPVEYGRRVKLGAIVEMQLIGTYRQPLGPRAHVVVVVIAPAPS